MRRSSGGRRAAAASSSSTRVRSRPRAPAAGTCIGPASDSARRTGVGLGRAAAEEPHLARGAERREASASPAAAAAWGSRGPRPTRALGLVHRRAAAGTGSRRGASGPMPSRQTSNDGHARRGPRGATRRRSSSAYGRPPASTSRPGHERRHPRGCSPGRDGHVVEQRLARLGLVALRVAARARTARRPTTRAAPPSRSRRAPARRPARRGTPMPIRPPVRQTCAVPAGGLGLDDAVTSRAATAAASGRAVAVDEHLGGRS